MKEVKKLKEILDMEDYLETRCYCPGEIYSFDGFFYQIFDGEDECKYLGTGKEHALYGYYPTIFVIATHEDNTQILMIADNKGRIEDICRCDATENNIKLVKELIKNGSSSLKFDEYEKGATAKGLKEIFSIADAIMID